MLDGKGPIIDFCCSKVLKKIHQKLPNADMMESSASCGLDECAATLLGLVVSLLVVAIVECYTISNVARSFANVGPLGVCEFGLFNFVPSTEQSML